jgi:hypothetical protein
MKFPLILIGIATTPFFTAVAQDVFLEQNVTVTTDPDLLIIEREKLKIEREKLNILKRQEEQRRIDQLNQERRQLIHNSSSIGDGVSTDDPSVSRLGWYYCIGVIQPLPHGCLATDWIPSSIDQPTDGKLGSRFAYIEGCLEGGETVQFITAYQSGQYSYTDNSGNKRVVPRYVFKSNPGLDNMKYNYTPGSARSL